MFMVFIFIRFRLSRAANYCQSLAGEPRGATRECWEGNRQTLNQPAARPTRYVANAGLLVSLSAGVNTP